MHSPKLPAIPTEGLSSMDRALFKSRLATMTATGPRSDAVHVLAAQLASIPRIATTWPNSFHRAFTLYQDQPGAPDSALAAACILAAGPARMALVLTPVKPTPPDTIEVARLQD